MAEGSLPPEEVQLIVKKIVQEDLQETSGTAGDPNDDNRCEEALPNNQSSEDQKWSEEECSRFVFQSEDKNEDDSGNSSLIVNLSRDSSFEEDASQGEVCSADDDLAVRLQAVSAELDDEGP